MGDDEETKQFEIAENVMEGFEMKKKPRQKVEEKNDFSKI